ncbi:MAG: TIGR02757 family protein [Desulfobacterales bacterium]|nr:TIGR02757 family protein [Desulfobacterales bacterium]
MANAPTKTALERLYRKYNRRALVHPDPLEFLYGFEDLRDREVAAMIAASLAYGRVAQIIKSVGAVLEVLGPNPAQALLSAEPRALSDSLCGFVHRFATGEKLCSFLSGIRRVLERFDSLQACFLMHRRPEKNSEVTALGGLAGEIMAGAEEDPGHLMPLPARGSACKRLHLFLRWMVRKDAVDPGGWDQVSPSELIVPLDTHMHRVGRLCGFTRRNTGDLRTALEITDGFRWFCPEDPVRYDFALTRVGMRGDKDFSEIFR